MFELMIILVIPLIAVGFLAIRTAMMDGPDTDMWLFGFVGYTVTFFIVLGLYMFNDTGPDNKFFHKEPQEETERNQCR